YAQGCWLGILAHYSLRYSGVYMYGDWRDPRVDGCLDDVPGVGCMAAAFSDQRNGRGLFALMTDAEDALGNFQLRLNTTVLLAPIPKPVPVSVADAGGTLTVDLAPVSFPAAGLFQDPAASCAGAAKGFTIYQKTVPPGGSPPVD